jgi:hypothetical protein
MTGCPPPGTFSSERSTSSTLSVAISSQRKPHIRWPYASSRGDRVQ